MKLSVRLFAALRSRAGTEVLELEDLPEGLSVGALKQLIEERHPELGSLAAVRGVLGTRYVEDETPLDPHSQLALLPPVSGGAPEPEELLESGLFELSSEPLDPEAARRRVSDPACGAAVVFVGSTRETNRGREVVRLDYEAFEAMSGPEMTRIFADCVERFGPPSAATAGEEAAARRLRLLCQHRTGVVEVGEPSVVVAVASPHRKGAFDACRFLIDTLKERLPVWKKEVYTDGEHWIGDRS